MSKYTDGKKTVTIIMHDWNGTQYEPSWEADFFQNGGLPFDSVSEAYIVKDVDYLVDMAYDWRDCKGDFSEDIIPEGIERVVDVAEEATTTYHVKSEYLSDWGSEITLEDVITEDELLRLSREWGKPIDELLDQLIPSDDRIWWIIDVRDDQTFETPTRCHTKEEALREARKEWNALTDHDRKRRSEFYICCAELSDGCIDYNSMYDIEYIKQ